MPPLMEIKADSAALIRALDRFPSLLEPRLKALSRQTAERIDQNATARVSKRTGATAEGIHVEDTSQGAIVIASETTIVGHTNRRTGRFHTQRHQDNVPLWLEFGTRRMTARPFFFEAARLEEGAYRRQVAETIQDVIDSQGLGD